MAHSPEVDINDVFQEILFSEEKIIDKSFQEGLLKGKRDGELNGYHLGYHRGVEIGFEIGFYKGVLKTVLDNDKHIEKSDRASKALQKLKVSLETFPRNNSEDFDIQADLNEIRAQYKKFIAIAKLNLSYPTFPKASF